MSSKTDVFREGHKLVNACSPSPVCAVTAMRSYFLAAHPQGPLFYFQSGHFLTRSVVVNLLQGAARHVGLFYESLKDHIRAASTAAATGLG